MATQYGWHPVRILWSPPNNHQLKKFDRNEVGFHISPTDRQLAVTIIIANPKQAIGLYINVQKLYFFCISGECMPRVHINVPADAKTQFHQVLGTGHHNAPQEVYS